MKVAVQGRLRSFFQYKIPIWASAEKKSMRINCLTLWLFIIQWDFLNTLNISFLWILKNLSKDFRFLRSKVYVPDPKALFRYIFGMVHSYPFLIYVYLTFTITSSFFTSHDELWNGKNPPFIFTFHFQSNHRTHKNCIIYDYIFLMIHFLLSDTFSPNLCCRKNFRKLYSDLFVQEFPPKQYSTDVWIFLIAAAAVRMLNKKHPEDKQSFDVV